MKTRLKAAAAAALVAGSLGAGSARAQGIPVIDIANLIQTILQVLNDVTEISNQVQQITQLQGKNVRVKLAIGATDGEVLSVPLAALTAGPGGA